MEGLFVRALQSYSSMMSEPSNAPGHLYPSAPMFQKSVPPLAVYPTLATDFGFSYEIVQYTPSGSLFATGLSRSDARDDDEDEDDTEADEEDGDDVEAVQRNPPRNRRQPCCGTGGHRRH
ncbi:hypothetical protein V6N13_059474 [Hibiscus sabdariffa]